MSRVVYRYELPVDDDWHEFPEGSVVLVAASRSGRHDLVEVWIEHADEMSFGGFPVKLRVFGTGHPIQDGENCHVGSVLAGPFVWHVYAWYERGGRH